MTSWCAYVPVRICGLWGEYTREPTLPLAQNSIRFFDLHISFQLWKFPKYWKARPASQNAQIHRKKLRP